MNNRTLARGLGIFGIGLGLVEIFAGGKLARAIGLKHHVGKLRMFGAREIGAGLKILNDPSNQAGMWARVAGDVLDLGLLGTALVGARKRDKIGATVATVSVLGVTALDVFVATQLTKQANANVITA